MFPPAPHHTAATTAAFGHPQVPAGKESRSLKGALSWARSPEQRQDSRQLSWDARSCCTHPLATSVPSICRAWLCASLPGGNKSLGELKEPESKGGDATEVPRAPSPWLLCRGEVARSVGEATDCTRADITRASPCPPTGTAVLPFPGCGGAAGGSSLNQTPAVCFLLPSTSHVHDRHRER